jgi:hypothetical protein
MCVKHSSVKIKICKTVIICCEGQSKVQQYIDWQLRNQACWLKQWCFWHLSGGCSVWILAKTGHPDWCFCSIPQSFQANQSINLFPQILHKQTFTGWKPSQSKCQDCTKIRLWLLTSRSFSVYYSLPPKHLTYRVFYYWWGGTKFLGTARVPRYSVQSYWQRC